MCWWYFIIGCDGQICHPPRKWYHNWGVAKLVLWCFLMCFQFWRLLVRALCFDYISSLDVMVRSVLLVGSGTPTVVACARLVKIWLTHQTKNWKQARVQSFILLKNWWTLGIHGCIWKLQCSSAEMWQSESFDGFSCAFSFEGCWVGPYVLMIFHYWMWWSNLPSP